MTALFCSMSTGVSVALWTRRCRRNSAFASITVYGGRQHPTLWRSIHEEEWTGGLTEEIDYTRIHSSIRSEDKLCAMVSLLTRDRSSLAQDNTSPHMSLTM